MNTKKLPNIQIVMIQDITFQEKLKLLEKTFIILFVFVLLYSKLSVDREERK